MLCSMCLSIYNFTRSIRGNKGGIAICIGIWLMAVAVVIAFLYGACGPDTSEEREQDWEDLKRYMERRNKNAK